MWESPFLIFLRNRRIILIMKRLSLRLRFFAFSLVFLVISGVLSQMTLPKMGKSRTKKTYTVQKKEWFLLWKWRLEMSLEHIFSSHVPGKIYSPSQIVDLSDYEDFLVTVTEKWPKEEDSVITVFAVDVKQSRPELRQSVFTEPDFEFLFPSGELATFKSIWRKIEFFPGEQIPNHYPWACSYEDERGLHFKKRWLPELLYWLRKKRETTGRKWRTVDIFVTLTEKAKYPRVFPYSSTESFWRAECLYALLSEATWISRKHGNSFPWPFWGRYRNSLWWKSKILCPSGYRCELESTEPDSTGVCVDANLAPSVVTKVLSRSPETIPNATPPWDIRFFIVIFKTEAIPTDGFAIIVMHFVSHSLFLVRGGGVEQHQKKAFLHVPKFLPKKLLLKIGSFVLMFFPRVSPLLIKKFVLVFFLFSSTR